MSETNPNGLRKQNDNLSWEEYFMATAFLTARRSKDPNTQVGACIVDNQNRILGIGYNGFPRGCNDNEFPWSKDSKNPLEQKYMYVVHAEVNAILNKNSANIEGSRMYVALFPCNECAKVIIQTGIKEIIYMSDKHADKLHTIAAKKMFDAVGLAYRQFIPSKNKICIDFTEIDWDEQNQLPPTPTNSNCDKRRVHVTPTENMFKTTVRDLSEELNKLA